MTIPVHAIFELLERDRRYKPDAYAFVREALNYAQQKMGVGRYPHENNEEPPPEAHLTGQQLCEAIRKFAIEQYGYLAKLVLGNWGISCTSDFGEIVYNMIEIELMKKSDQDRREDFDDCYDFDEVFQQNFEVTLTE